MSKVNVLIVGATGYIGIQLVKLLNKHKKVNIKYLCGSSNVGKKLIHFDKSFNSKKLPKIVKFNKKFLKNVDVIFTALPNGQSQKISKYLLKKNVLIDLSADFRLRKSIDFQKWYKIKHKAKNLIEKSVYAIPEIKPRTKTIVSKIPAHCADVFSFSVKLFRLSQLYASLRFINTFGTVFLLPKSKLVGSSPRSSFLLFAAYFLISVLSHLSASSVNW